MKLSHLVLLPLFASLPLVGCGSSTEAQVSEANAKLVTRQMVSAVTQARTSNNGQAAAYSIASAGQSAQSIITPVVEGASALTVGTAQQADTSGTAECTDTGCTFTSYADTSGGSSWVIDGTESWSSSKFACDLTMTGSYGGFTWNFHEIAALTLTDTSIDGTLTTDGSYDLSIAGVGGGTVTWNSTVTFKAVKYDAAGCPTSGSIDVEASTDAGAGSYDGSGTVTFDGSGC